MIIGHGDDMYRYSKPVKYNFSSNVYGKIDNSGLKAYLKNCMDTISNYPEPRPFTLEKKLAVHFGIPSSDVCVTNGATNAIYLIASAFRVSKSAVLIPTFSEYSDACRMNAHTVCFLNSIDDVSDEFDMVWICNPNNPTGTVLPKDKLTDLFNSHPSVVFVVDQSYEYFTIKSLHSVNEVIEFPNVIQLHSMTKKYAIPGLRLGYMIANHILMKRIEVYLKPWSVNCMAIEAGLYILSHCNDLKLDIREYLQESQRLRDALDTASENISVLPSDTHFMLAKLKGVKSKDLKLYLAEQGILIRDASNFIGLDEAYFRVATQTRQENNILIESVEGWLQKVSR